MAGVYKRAGAKLGRFLKNAAGTFRDLSSNPEMGVAIALRESRLWASAVGV